MEVRERGQWGFISILVQRIVAIVDDTGECTATNFHFEVMTMHSHSTYNLSSRLLPISYSRSSDVLK